MNEQSTPQNTNPDQNSTSVQPATPLPQPVTPDASSQPMTPAPDPAMYQPPATPISSRPTKVPLWLYITIGVTFAVAIGLLVAVLLLM